MNVTLLGPQRNVSAARSAVAELMPTGDIATINAGWQERESDSAELADVLGGRMRNLRLYGRWQQILADDAAIAAEEHALTALLGEAQALYAIRLHHAMAALEAINRRQEIPEVSAAARRDAIASVQRLDAWHLTTVAQARSTFFARLGLGAGHGLPESLQRHRAEIAEEVSRCIGLVVAGGHVGVLLHLLHVFGLADMVRATADRPLITWSAGAMALSERVVLFHDHLVPPGSKDLAYRPAELYAEGLGIYSGLLPFPHARRRLQQDDVDHVRQIAERFAPRTCLLLPDGVRVDVREHEPLPAGTRWLSPADGVVIQPESV